LHPTWRHQHIAVDLAAVHDQRPEPVLVNVHI
jgi:hypothetical protein